MINHNGKEYLKKNVYIYVQLNHFTVQRKLTHYKSTILQLKENNNNAALSQEGRGDSEHARKAEISGRVAGGDLSDGQSRLKRAPSLRSICGSLGLSFWDSRIAAPGKASGRWLFRGCRPAAPSPVCPESRGPHAHSWDGARASSSSQPGKTWAGAKWK